jgi:hypothetical protein
MSIKPILAALVLVGISGCTGSLIDGSLVLQPESTSSSATAPAAIKAEDEDTASVAASKSTIDIADGLMHAYNGERNTGESGKTAGASTVAEGSLAIRGTIPPAIRNSPVVDCLLNNYAAGYVPAMSYKSLHPSVASSFHALTFKSAPAQKAISACDLKTFVSDVFNYVGVGAKGEGVSGGKVVPAVAASTGEAETKDEVLNRIVQYLVVYFQGKFVDRQGNAFSAPTVSGNKLSDAELDDALSIVMEAISDSSFKLPVFYQLSSDGNKTKTWILSTNEDSSKEPTCAVLESDLETQVGSPLSLGDIRLMHYFVRMAGRQGEFISGMLFRTFGKINAGQFVLAGVSIGDNQLLATLVDTFFETGSRRLTEANIYTYLANTPPGKRPVALQNLLQTVESVYDAEDNAAKRNPIPTTQYQ